MFYPLYDPQAGVFGVVAVDNLALGPAIGGCRRAAYPSWTSLLNDAASLARSMTLKAAFHQLPHGGAKAVLFHEPALPSSPLYWPALGKAINALEGNYITTVDVGTHDADLTQLVPHTPHCIASSSHGSAGNPSPATALGLVHAMEAMRAHLSGQRSIHHTTLAIQGLGDVGMKVCQHAHARGAHLIVSDLDPKRVQQASERFGARGVPPSELLQQPCDLLVPCAMGSVITPTRLSLVRAQGIVGAANGICDQPSTAEALHQRGILYCPDFVSNGGGLMAASLAHRGADAGQVQQRVATLFETTLTLLSDAQAQRRSPWSCAVKQADVTLRRALDKKHQRQPDSGVY